MNNETVNDFLTKWPLLEQARERLSSAASRKFSFSLRRESDSSLLSTSHENTNSTMQQCLPICEPDVSVEKSTYPQALEPCPVCFDPSDPPIMTDIFDATRERQYSEPMRVPHLSQTPLTNSPQQPHQQSHSSGYDSAFGNGLSPTTNYWTTGVADMSSYPSSICDDLLNDQNGSVCDGSSTTGGPDDEDDGDIDDDAFEVLSFDTPPESTIYFKEFEHTTSISQNNVCGCCAVAFSSISNLPARRCHYYGKLYCTRCHITDYAHIPAKIVKTFDIRLYPVCRRAKSILQLNFYQPVFDIQNDNENLYILNPLLVEIKAIRSQFQHFYAYLSTCQRFENELNEKFFKEFYAREYLYQSVHLYSLDDLLSLKKVYHILNRASIRAREHINQCVSCREKGFTCEICKKRSDVLYPFDDMKIIAQCTRCSNIYHRQCWDRIDHDCSKCYRIIQRKRIQETM